MNDTQPSKLTGAEVLGSARWNSIGQSVSQAVRFLSYIALARILAPDQFGVMGMALFVVDFLGLFQNMGTTAAIIQMRDLPSNVLSSVYWLNVLVGLILGAALFLFSGVPTAIFADQRLAPMLQVIALVFVVVGFGNVPRALLNRDMRFGTLAIGEMTTTSLYAAIAIVMAIHGFGVWSIVIAYVAQSVLMTAVLVLVSRWMPRLHFSWADVQMIFRFSANLTAFDILNYLLFNADRLIVARFLGAGAFGIYDLANRMAGYFVRFFLPPVLGVLFPAMARINNDNQALQRGLERATAGVVLVFFPVIVGIASVSDIFVKVVLDPRWQPLAVIVPILAVRYLLELVLRSVAVVYRVKGRTDLLLYWGIGSGTVFVVSYFFGLHWGLVGITISQSVAMCILTYPALRIPLSLIHMPIPRILWALAPYGLACALMAVAVRIFLMAGRELSLSEPAQLVGAIGIGAIVYGAMILVLRPRELPDLIYLVRGS